MAALDDFFAKKDRKKKPTKKFVTPDDLSKSLEITTLRAAEAKTGSKLQPPPQQSQKPSIANNNDDDVENVETVEAPVVQDEWKDFEEESKKDYTGLKIGHMNINDDSYYGTDEDGDDGDGEDGAKDPGAWSKVDESTATNAATTPAVRPAEPIEKTDAGKVKYISPFLQQQKLQPVNLRKGLLPDLQNQELFPSLDAAKTEELRRKKNEPAFEEVRHGGRLQRPSNTARDTPVAVENRYNSLADS